jgi:hypothetical protein
MRFRVESAENKEAKTFAHSATGWGNAKALKQKFFGSFFKKSCLLSCIRGEVASQMKP